MCLHYTYCVCHISVYNIYIYIIYIYITNAGLSLEWRHTTSDVICWQQKTLMKNPTKVQKQEVHAAFGRPRLCFQAFTKSCFSNKRWLKRAPSQQFSFSGSQHFKKIIFSTSKHPVQEGSTKIPFRNILATWCPGIFPFDWRGISLNG